MIQTVWNTVVNILACFGGIIDEEMETMKMFYNQWA